MARALLFLMDYPHKVEPFPHQREEFEAHWDSPARGLWWEMGCAKSKTAIDSISKLFMAGKIDCALILAPKAVAPNWARTEIPAHMPDEIRAKTRVFLWNGAKCMTQAYQRELEQVLEHKGPIVVCMSYPAIRTEMTPKTKRVKKVKKTYKGAEFARALLETRTCKMVLDESARIKSPDAKLSRRVIKAGKLAAYRQALTGTPIANSPFDVFNQVRFLDPDFWARRGCKDFAAFKNTYGTFVTRLQDIANCPHPEGMRPNCGCPTFPLLVEYKNLEDLGEALKAIGSRHLKSEVLSHLPPQLYDRRFFTLSARQQRLYTELRENFMVELAAGLITAPLAITRLLRLQEIASGYCPTDDGVVVVDPDNERIEVLREVVEDCPHQMIVWAKFRHDFRLIEELFTKMGVSHGTYIGDTPHDRREQIRDDFQDGKIKVFLANPACAGEGLTLTNAQTVVYYNNTFSMTDRLQSEARAHRPGQKFSVTYIDIVAEGTVDEKILDALRAKKDIADMVLRDPTGGWI